MNVFGKNDNDEDTGNAHNNYNNHNNHNNNDNRRPIDDSKSRGISNQETELAAMADDLQVQQTPPNTEAIEREIENEMEMETQTQTQKQVQVQKREQEANMNRPETALDSSVAPRTPSHVGDNLQSQSPQNYIAEFLAPPNTSPLLMQHSGVQPGGGVNSSSLKKRRHRSVTQRRNGNEARLDLGVLGATANSVATGSIKTSQSMTSLPPDEKHESRDVIKAKLRVERPYNSLKKNAGGAKLTVGGGCNTLGSKHQHRYSWGSGHSSSSLHSSATLGLGSGKDDLWAAIQTNYNYIMDTNLLDTCKEARCEIEGAVSVMESPTDCCFKMMDGNQRSEGSCEDPKELRRWLREMEHKLDNAPSLSEATLFSISELQCHLEEHSVLYHEIVSHARVVSACIRAASEKEQQQQQQQQLQLQLQEQQQQSLTSNSSSLGEQNSSSLSSTDDTTATTTTTTTTTATCAVKLSKQLSGSGSGSSSSGICTSFGHSAANSPAAPSNSHSHSNNHNTSNSNSSGGGRKSTDATGYWERLQNRYHLLYLKAFEVQLWLDGLLRKKSSSASVLNDDLDDDDDDDEDSYECEAGVATEDDLNNATSDLESDEGTRNSSSFSDLQRCSDHVDSKPPAAGAAAQQQQRDCIHDRLVIDCEDGDDEQDDEDEVDYPHPATRWSHLRFSPISITCNDKKCVRAETTAAASKIVATLTDFEADSESSDVEYTSECQRRHRRSYAQLQQHNTPTKVKTATETVAKEPQLLGLGYQSYQQKIAKVAITSTPMQARTVGSSETQFWSINDNSSGSGSGSSNSTNSIRSTTIAAATTAAATTTTTAAAATQTQDSLDGNIMQEQPQQQSGNTNNRYVVAASRHKNIAVITPNCHNNNSINNNNNNNMNSNILKGKNKMSNKCGSPGVLRKRQQQQQIDVSKFNRSNRKSKNCAIFYFKHLDTDNDETTSYGVGDNDDGDGDGDVDGDIDVYGGMGSGGISSSTSHTSDQLLKSAEPSSDDDEGWLYSSAPAPAPAPAIAPTLSVPTTVSSIDCLNSTGTVATVIVEGLQSATVSSTTTTTTAATTGAQLAAVGSDDSDKENKEALALTANQLQLQQQQQQQRSGVAAVIVGKANTANVTNTHAISSSSCSSGSGSGSGSGSSSEASGRSYSSDFLTETTTSATTTTQVTQMHCQPAAKQTLQRTEMELQINGVGGTGGEGNFYAGHVAKIIQHQGNNKSIHIISDNGPATTSIAYNTNNNNNHQPSQRQSESPQWMTTDTNGNPQKAQKQSSLCTHSSINLLSVQQPQMSSNPGNRLPPRSPAKSGKSLKSLKSHGALTGAATATAIASPKEKISHESIKQLVLEAEHLVRDEALKTPTKQQKHSITKISTTVKKRDVIMPGPIKQRVQEWLEHQPATPQQLYKTEDALLLLPPLHSGSGQSSPTRNDDCEASGEASETESIPQPGSDTSEGFTDSIATCMQTSTNSYGNSTERIGGSAEPIVGANTSTALGYGSSNQSLNVNVIKIIKRQQTRRKSERPWSVSCLSQLSTETAQIVSTATKVCNVQVCGGLANHSISESALDSLSPGRPRASSNATTHSGVAGGSHAKTYDSKGSSLKRRKTRKKKYLHAPATTYSAGKKTDSGSEETAVMPKLTQSLVMKSCESMSAQQQGKEAAGPLVAMPKLTNAEILTANGGAAALQGLTKQIQPNESDEDESQLMKPNFRVGSYTTAYMRSEARLGSLAALATYMNEDEQQGEYTTGTEDHHSSFSETAWDNYQEKYNSENYSEGFDSDAARRLMEFGDDYRNFIDSQSDCCSSLSAANNLDSLSPPRMDSLQQNEAKLITQDTIASSVDHARRRRALELEYERRRKTLEVRRKSCQENTTDINNPRSPTISLSSSANALTPRNGEKFNYQHKQDPTSRKLDFGMSHSAQSLRRTSESDNSIRRRKADERRRSSRNLEKSIKVIPATSSSSCDDSDGEKEMRNLLQQSRNSLEDTRALKIRCHLLRPEDYTEIISTCRENIRCLDSVLRGPPGTVLSAQCVGQTKDLLAGWEDLLGWSENAAAARKMQEEMIILKHHLNRLGNKSAFELLDTEPSIQIAIEALKNEKSQLQTYRTSMLRLNASVHSWLTRQERKLHAAIAEQRLKEAAAKITEELAEQQAIAIVIEEVVAAGTAQIDAESEQRNAQQQQQLAASAATTPVSASTCMAVSTSVSAATSTDNNGNEVATPNATSGKSLPTSDGSDERAWDFSTLVSSENELHKHLKNEVSEMYSAWDEADARINTQLEVLTNSLIAWRQLECGLSEFQQALGQDRGTLKGLEGALSRGQATPVELAQNVKLVAKLLSENVKVSQEQLTAVQEHLDPNHTLHIARFTASNGSLSDSGISDGGTTSDGGLSEREHRLGVLRRLAKQLESALAPGSEAMKSIAARMESAEAELKTLQNTCRDLIVRTAASHQSKKQQQQQQQQRDQHPQDDEENLEKAASSSNYKKTNGHIAAGGKKSPPNACKTKRKPRKYVTDSTNLTAVDGAIAVSGRVVTGSTGPGTHMSVAPDSGDPADDPDLEFDMDASDDENGKAKHNSWRWRIAKAAVPMQLALFTFLCAACLMQPNCCDNLNNLSMSFTPQLRYIRGPPPI